MRSYLSQLKLSSQELQLARDFDWTDLAVINLSAGVPPSAWLSVELQVGGA